MAGLWRAAAHPQFWVWSHDSQWLRGWLRAWYFLKWSSLVAQWWRANAGDPGMLGRSPGGGNGNPLQYPCLGNPKDRGVWQATVYGVTNSQTWLSNWTTIPENPKAYLFAIRSFFKIMISRVVVFYIPLNSIHPWITSPTTTPQLQ